LSLNGVFITGTDTGVGKTTVACGILRYARDRGLRPVPFKPVETGCDPDPIDAMALRRAAQSPLSMAMICPYPLRLAAAPAQAAAAEGVTLDLGDLAARCRAAARMGDYLVVEGAGGLLVPYAGDQTTLDLAALLGLPMLVVGRTALGTVNHTCLTWREAQRAKLPLAGILLNQTQARRAPHESGNDELIAALTGSRPLGTFPYLPPGAGWDERAARALSTTIRPADLARIVPAP
jgi:dethiobiotin synthetase